MALYKRAMRAFYGVESGKVIALFFNIKTNKHKFPCAMSFQSLKLHFFIAMKSLLLYNFNNVEKYCAI